ncbi:MAG: LPS export ABC transporter permease LptG [Shimia sp.]
MILHRYIGRRFLGTFAGVFAVFLGLIVLFDLMDQVRRFAGQGVSFVEIVGLTLLSSPQGLYRILPLIVIIATLAMFLRMARTSELVVARAAGKSAMRVLTAPILLAFMLGVLAVGVLNPIVAATAQEYETRTNRIGVDLSSTLSVSDEGLWLRQGTGLGQTVIHAAAANLDGTELRDATFLDFTVEGTPRRRIEAARATLRDGAWALEDAKSWPLLPRANAETNATTHDALTIASDLTAERIRDSFGTPSAIPIWELPAFVSRLEEAGFSARRHLTWLHIELAQPAFLVAMLLIGAAFTMQHTRVSRTGVMVLSAVLLGFALYFVRNFAQILGENGQMPILLAAWTPPLVAIGLALGLILHLEDG